MKLNAYPKTVMAITLTVMFGLLFGVAGYLVFNKPKINPPVAITPPPAEEKVAISTDKTGYEQGETVKITVRNSLNKSIWDFAHCGPNPFWNLQKFDGNEWKELNFSLPHQDPRQKKEKEICDFVMCERPELTELKPNSEINYDWSIATICEWPLSPIGMPTTEPKIIKEGTYRVVIAYGFSKDSSFSEGKTIYSNEFTIKEKIASDTSDWQTYRNEEYGFEFKYPEDWEIYEDELIIRIFPATPKNMSPEERRNLSELWPSFFITTYENQSNLSLNEFFEKEILPRIRPEIDHQVRQVKINDVDAITFTEIGMSEAREYVVVNNKRLIIKISFTIEEIIPDTPVIPVFNQILSTFKFIEK